MKSKYILAALAILMTSTIHAKDYKEQFATYGIGSEPCSSYTDARKRGGHIEDGYRQWLSGYVSAFNLIVSSTTFDIFGSTDFEGMIGWLDNRCTKYPRANLTNTVARFTEIVFPYRKQVKPGK